MATQAERYVALELMGAVAFTTFREMSKSGLPKPSTYVGDCIVFVFLAVAAAFPTTGMIAPAFGGLYVLAMMLAPDKANKGAPYAATVASNLENFTARRIANPKG